MTVVGSVTYMPLTLLNFQEPVPAEACYRQALDCQHWDGGYGDCGTITYGRYRPSIRFPSAASYFGPEWRSCRPIILEGWGLRDPPSSTILGPWQGNIDSYSSSHSASWNDYPAILELGMGLAVATPRDSGSARCSATEHLCRLQRTAYGIPRDANWRSRAGRIYSPCEHWF